MSSEPEDNSLAEEAMFRLRYGDVLDGLSRMYDEYEALHNHPPHHIELVPLLYRAYITGLDIKRRWIADAHKWMGLTFQGVPLCKGKRCLAT